MNLANLGETEQSPQLGSYTHLIVLIRLVIRYRSGPAPAPVPVPVPFPAPCFSSCPLISPSSLSDHNTKLEKVSLTDT